MKHKNYKPRLAYISNPLSSHLPNQAISLSKSAAKAGWLPVKIIYLRGKKK